MVKRHKKLIIFLIILVILGVGGYFLVTRVILKQNKMSGSAMPQINTVSLTKMDLTDSVSATGTIESASTSTVSANVQNVTVDKVLVSVGDSVTKGQKLVTFDKSELKEALSEAQQDYSDTVAQTSSELSQAYQQLSQARANYASDKARLEKVVKEAEKALKKAKKRAKKNKQSVAVSSAVGAGAPPDMDPGTGSDTNSGSGTGGADSGSGSTGGSQISDVTITDNMTVAEARSALTKAKENLATANSQNQQSIRQAQNSVTQAQNSVKKSLRQSKQSVQDAKETLKSASIKATMDGTVTALGVQEGDTYNGGDAVEISDLSHFQVSTTVDEYDITKVEKGQRVVILTDATGDTEIEGEITFVALTTGSSTLSDGNATGSSDMGASMGGSSSSSGSGYEVTISLKDTDANIRSGMTAKCSIIINEATDVYAVPYDAIHTGSDNEDVIYVMDSSGRKEVKVTKGMESDYYVAVSSPDLSENMSVIIPSDATSTGGSSDESGESGFGMFGGGDFSGGPPSGDFSGGPPSGFSDGSFPGAPPG